MRSAELAHRSFVRRCALIALSLVVGAACSSSGSGRGPFATTPTPTASTTATEGDVPSSDRPATSSGSETSEGSATSIAATTTAATTTTIPLPTTTTLPLVLTGGVIKVANATDIENAAQRLTDEFAALGFALEKPTNAAGKDEVLTVSKIYVKAGSEAVAQSVSFLMGGIEMLRMPTPAWINGGTAALGDTTVLVMLGSDLAGSPLLVMRFAPGRQGPD